MVVVVGSASLKCLRQDSEADIRQGTAPMAEGGGTSLTQSVLAGPQPNRLKLNALQSAGRVGPSGISAE